MAAPNYKFEKRKRDNAKKAAKEAKRQKKRKKRTAPSSAPDLATPPPQKRGRITRLPPPIHTAPSGESSIAAILCSLDSPTKAGAARRLGVPVSALASCSAADIHAAIAAGDGRDDVTSATFTFDDIVAWSHADRVVVLDAGELAADGRCEDALDPRVIERVWKVPVRWIGEPNHRALISG